MQHNVKYGEEKMALLMLVAAGALVQVCLTQNC